MEGINVYIMDFYVMTSLIVWMVLMKIVTRVKVS